MARESLSGSRWWLVVAAAGAMGIGGIYQFAWSSIRGPLGSQLAASETALGTVFTVFVIFQTVSQFPAGWVRDRYGPRWPLLVGAAFLLVGYLGTATATSVTLVYAAYAVGGIGAGIAYTVAMNTPVKWFEERRGLATGIVGTAYGGVSFLLIPAIRQGVASRFAATLVALAIGSGLVVVVAAVVLRDPPGMAIRAADESAGTDGARGGDSDVAFGWRQTLATWQFWLLYAVFVVVNGVGLMLIGKAVTYAGQFDLAPAIATAGASAIAVADAGGVLGGGWLSDRLGGVRTVAVTLVLSGVALGVSVPAGEAGAGAIFVLLVGAVAFFRSPIFAVFPGLVGTFYGERHSSTNYALLYSAKLWGGLLAGTVASGLVVRLGWTETFVLGAALLVAAGLAMTLVRPVHG